MKTLIYAADKALAEEAKEWLDSFGKGLHVFAASRHDAEAVQNGHWSYAICLGEEPKFSMQTIHYKMFAHTENRTELKRALWALYRDELADCVGGRCSCGLHEVCHCH